MKKKTKFPRSRPLFPPALLGLGSGGGGKGSKKKGTSKVRTLSFKPQILFKNILFQASRKFPDVAPPSCPLPPPAPPLPPGLLLCPVCGESFRERHHLTRHMTAHQVFFNKKKKIRNFAICSIFIGQGKGPARL